MTALLLYFVTDNRNVTATVVYNNAQSAMYARDKIHGLEYPPGERLIIRLGHETASMMANADPFNGGGMLKKKPEIFLNPILT